MVLTELAAQITPEECYRVGFLTWVDVVQWFLLDRVDSTSDYLSPPKSYQCALSVLPYPAYPSFTGSEGAHVPAKIAL